MLLERGYANTTVREVARRAGYTTGALVHYFGDKDDLIRQTLQHFGTEVRDRMEAARSAGRGRAALLGVLQAALPLDRRLGASWRIWLALWYHSEQSPQMREEERTRYREWIGRISTVLRESIELGELPASDFDVAAEARAIVALIDGLGVQYLMANGRLGARRMSEIVERYVDRLYASPA